jgi:class 3 adenylate cyclase
MPIVRRVRGAADLPEGEAAFLFTDIEASTLLLQRLGAPGYAMLQEHYRGIVGNAVVGEAGALILDA